MKRQRLVVTVLVSVVLVICSVSVVGAEEPRSREQIRHFLRSADIVAWRPIGRGITQPWRLTLSDGLVTHDAAFQSVDTGAASQRFGRNQPEVVDSYRYNIAALLRGSKADPQRPYPQTRQRPIAYDAGLPS